MHFALSETLAVLLAVSPSIEVQQGFQIAGELHGKSWCVLIESLSI